MKPVPEMPSDVADITYQERIQTFHRDSGERQQAGRLQLLSELSAPGDLPSKRLMLELIKLRLQEGASSSRMSSRLPGMESQDSQESSMDPLGGSNLHSLAASSAGSQFGEHHSQGALAMWGTWSSSSSSMSPTGNVPRDPWSSLSSFGTVSPATSVNDLPPLSFGGMAIHPARFPPLPTAPPTADVAPQPQRWQDQVMAFGLPRDAVENDRRAAQSVQDEIGLEASEIVPTIGSMRHGESCKPCIHFNKGSCQFGFECTFCHLFHDQREVARIRPGKLTRQRLASVTSLSTSESSL